MNNIAFLGPMWSGKTTASIKAAQESGRSFQVVDFLNSRKSDRDLSIMFPGKSLRHPDFILKNSILIIDEMHFFQVFNKEELLEELIKTARERSTMVIFSGLEFDCYNNFLKFEIWNRINHHIKTWNYCYSLIPCVVCKQKNSRMYTQPAKGSEVLGMTGDHYNNICKNCLEVKK